MKKLIALAALAALAACGDRTEEAAPEDTATAEATTAAAGMGEDPTGSYTVTMTDGSTGTTVINADGTYVDTDKDGKQVKGTFARRDGKDCFDPEGEGAEECWTIGTTNPDGSFTATAPDGKTTVTVTRSAGGAATATPAPAAS
jgi:ABC-type transport system substrate-binding protein